MPNPQYRQGDYGLSGQSGLDWYLSSMLDQWYGGSNDFWNQLGITGSQGRDQWIADLVNAWNGASQSQRWNIVQNNGGNDPAGMLQSLGAPDQGAYGLQGGTGSDWWVSTLLDQITSGQYDNQINGGASGRAGMAQGLQQYWSTLSPEQQQAMIAASESGNFPSYMDVFNASQQGDSFFTQYGPQPEGGGDPPPPGGGGPPPPGGGGGYQQGWTGLGNFLGQRPPPAEGDTPPDPQADYMDRLISQRFQSPSGMNLTEVGNTELRRQIQEIIDLGLPPNQRNARLDAVFANFAADTSNTQWWQPRTNPNDQDGDPPTTHDEDPYPGQDQSNKTGSQSMSAPAPVGKPSHPMPPPGEQNRLLIQANPPPPGPPMPPPPQSNTQAATQQSFALPPPKRATYGNPNRKKLRNIGGSSSGGGTSDPSGNWG